MNRAALTTAADIHSTATQTDTAVVDGRWQRPAECVTLILILAIFCFQVVRLHPREFFGFFQDDTIYFSTAKALASGQGYVLPSFPGVLPQTKYPILYPLILSLIWRIQPNFPANLTLAVAVSVAIAAAYLLLSYLFIRRLGISRAIGLCVLAAIALHPELEWFAGVLLSDYLFALLVVASVLAADQAWLDSKRTARWGLVTGILLGLAVLARSAAVGVIAGMALHGVLQRRWRPLALMFVTCVVIAIIGTAATHAVMATPLAAGAGEPPTAFQQVAMYASNYTGFWLLSVPSTRVLGVMLLTNLRILLLAPGNYFIMPNVILPASLFTFALTLVVTAGSVGGIVRLYRSSARRSLIFALVGSLPILLVWNFIYYDRFLLPFVPLLFLGLAIELLRIGKLLRASVEHARLGTRILALVMAALLIGLILTAANNYWQLGHRMRNLSEGIAMLNHERREAYDWLLRNASPTDRIIAYADSLTYLYTDRKSAHPVDLTTDCRYRPEKRRCAFSFDQLFASGRYVCARYWITTPGDFDQENAAFGADLRESVVDGLQTRLHPVFVSSDGTVLVYDTTCLLDPRNCPNTNRKNNVDGTRDGVLNCSTQ